MSRIIMGILMLAIPAGAAGQSQIDDLLIKRLKIATESILAKAKSDILATSGIKVGLIGSVVKNCPFSAEFLAESDQVLSDGTRIHRSSRYLVYRDRFGRLRRESDAGEICITDPVANAGYLIDERNQRALKYPLAQAVTGQNQAAFAGIRAGRDWQVIAIQGQPRPGNPATSESLGKQTLAGVEAQGTRLTETIPVGAIGNDRVIQIVSETWYAPILQLQLVLRHSDPRIGETVYRVLSLSRNEPAAELFGVPPQYKVIVNK